MSSEFKHNATKEEFLKDFLSTVENASDFTKKCEEATSFRLEGDSLILYKGADVILTQKLAGKLFENIVEIKLETEINKSKDTEGSIVNVLSNVIQGLYDHVDFSSVDDIDLNQCGALVEPFTSLINKLGGAVGIKVDDFTYISSKDLEEARKAIMDHRRDVLASMIEAGEKGYMAELEAQAKLDGMSVADYLLCLEKHGYLSHDRLKDVLANEIPKATNARVVIDPVVIDLNGNNTITTTINKGPHFDLNSDGFAEKTEWIEKEDGFLVLDLNDNGLVDNGSELIGDGQVLLNGQLSKNGLEVLLDKDLNKDKVLDSKDKIFSMLKVWVDANANGVTDKGELKTLKELGIAGIKLDSAMGKGIKIGSVIKEDGTEVMLGDLFFNVDTVDSKEKEVVIIKDNLEEDDKNLTNEIKLMPQVIATGTLSSLRNAMFKDAGLKDLVKEFISDAKGKNLDLIDKIIFKWCNVEGIAVNSRGTNMDARILGVIEKFLGHAYQGADGPNPNRNAAPILNGIYNSIRDYVFTELSRQSYLAKYRALIDAKYSLTGHKIYHDLSRLEDSIKDNKDYFHLGMAMKDLKDTYSFDEEVSAKLEKLINRFKDKSYEFTNGYGINRYAAESEGNNQISAGSGNYYLDGNDLDEKLYGSAGNDYLDGKKGNDYLDGGVGNDVYVFAKGYGQDTINNESSADTDVDVLKLKDIKLSETKIEININGDLIFKVPETGDSITIAGYFKGGKNAIEQIVFADNKVLTYPEMYNYGQSIGMTVYGSDNSTTLKYTSQWTKFNVIGGKGNEAIYTAAGNDVLDGGDGNDTLYAGEGMDTLYGGLGNDVLYGQGGNDTLDGGAGNDTLDGGVGNDIYIYGKRYGQDVISNYSSGANDTDILKLKDINFDEAEISILGTDLIIRVKGTEDFVKVAGYFDTRYPTNVVEEIEFADGTVMTYEKMLDYARNVGSTINGNGTNASFDYSVQWSKYTFNGTDANETVSTGSGNDVLVGGKGNDILSAGAGNDVVTGGEGNDTLYGGTGNDILDGGVDNDYLEGGADNDTYIFAKGYGQDTINNASSGANDIDILKLKDINFNEVEIRANVNDLIIKVKSTGDSVTIKNYLAGGANSLDKIEFADGSFKTFEDMVKYVTEVATTVTGNEIDKVLEYGNQWAKYSVQGGIASETINVGSGNDIVKGGAGNDTINGGAGNDVLYGEAGNDIINGGVGDDILDGGFGNDTLDGGAGNDTYIFGKGYGQDVINNYYSAANDTDVLKLKDINFDEVDISILGTDLIIRVKGTEDSIRITGYFDTRYPGNIIEEIKFSDGTIKNYEDMLKYAKEVGTVIKGIEQNTTFDYSGQWSKYTFEGSSANETVSTGAGNDVIHGGAGNDVVNSGAGNDVLYGEAGNDILTGGDGDDILDGGKDNDTLAGGTGNDTYIFGKGYGQDIINNSTSAAKDTDVLKLKDIKFKEVEFAFDVNDLIIKVLETGDSVRIQGYLAGGLNSLERIEFADKIVKTYEELVKYAKEVGTNIKGTDQNASLNYSAQVSKYNVQGGIGSETIATGTGNDIVDGGEGNDSISGGAGNDQLFGGAGNDTINGGAGNDILDGGVGDDTLDGADGDDVYIFGKGYGHDTINNYHSAATDIDILRFKDVKFDEVETSISGNNLIITIKETGDSVTIAEFFNTTYPTYALEKIEFADGTVKTYNDMYNLVREVGTKIQGNSESKTYNYANQWAKFIFNGGDGSEVVTTGTADDILNGGAGNDILNGGLGNDQLLGGVGNDELHGGDGDDILDGGTGNDILDGGAGNDIYIFAKGYGKDIINNYSSGANDTDVLKLKDIKFKEVEFAFDVNDLIIKVPETGDSIRVQGYLAGGTYSLERIEFADKVVKNYAELVKYAKEVGTKLEGSSENVALNYSAQVTKYTVQGGSGSETITTGSGNDLIHGGDGNDAINGGAGNDVLYGDAGNDAINGGAGNDILDGGAGDDTLDGAAGNDTYVFGKGYGHDTINNYNSAATDIDVLKFKDVNFDEVEVSISGNYLTFTIKETGDSVTIAEFFNSTYPTYGLDEIQFADGTVKTYNDMLTYAKEVGTTIKGSSESKAYNLNQWSRFVFNGGSGSENVTTGSSDDVLNGGRGNDVLYGGTGSDSLYGQEDNDTLYGQDGDDILDGGTGNDYLDGGAGNDTYIFAKGYGNDIINNYSSGASDTDCLLFDDIEFSEVVISANVNDLIIKVPETGDSVTIQNYFAGGTYEVEEIEFADGTIMSPEEMRDYVKQHATIIKGQDEDSTLDYSKQWSKYSVTGGAENDTIKTGSGNDTLDGGDGNDVLYAGAGTDKLYGGKGRDTLYGEAGNDTLDGGAGNDTLVGGAGSDTYIFGKGYGNDTIDNSTSAADDIDVLKFKDVKFADVEVNITGNNLAFRIKSTGDTVTIANYFAGGVYSVEEIEFADGTVKTFADMKEYADEVGTTVKGTNSNIAYDYSKQWVKLNFQGGLGSENITGGLGNDVINGGRGNDVINGFKGNDTLYGDRGNDTLYGGEGDDILDGGKGNDTLDGGVGNDTYIFAKGYGKDVINNGTSAAGDVDTLRLTDIKLSEAEISVRGNDLIIGVQGTRDSVTIINYFAEGKFSLEEIEFADGTTKSVEEMRAYVKEVGTKVSGDEYDKTLDYSTQWAKYNIKGGSGNEIIKAGLGNDLVDGGDGKDTIYGGDGNDTLFGGKGNDNLYGQGGNDTLDGGAGNDYLEGGIGDDTYVFGKGYGSDIINNASSDDADVDILNLTDLSLDDINIAAKGNDLEISIKETSDKVTIQNYLLGEKNSIEEIHLAKDKVMTFDDVKEYLNPTPKEDPVETPKKEEQKNLALMNQVYCATSSELPISEISYSKLAEDNKAVNIFKAK